MYLLFHMCHFSMGLIHCYKTSVFLHLSLTGQNLAIFLAIMGLRVYPYPRIYSYPNRTRGSGTGRVNILRVLVGSGRQVTGTAIPEFYP